MGDGYGFNYPPNYGLAGPSQTSQDPYPYEPPTPGGLQIGQSVPTAGGGLIYVGDDSYGQPQFQYVRDQSTGVSAGDVYQAQQQAARDAARLAEDQRQFNEQFGYNKAAFNIDAQQEEAKFNWQQAVDARDFAAAEAWKQRYYQLDQAKFGQQQYTDEAAIAQAQNRGAFDYINLLSQMRGPRDYGQYWYTSRGMTQPQGEAAIPYEQAIPTAFQPRTVPTRQSFLGAAGPAFAPFGAQQGPAFVQPPVPPVAPVPETRLVRRNDQRRNIPKGATTVVAPIGPAEAGVQPARTVSLAAGYTPEEFLKRLAPY